jgi:hypothetical protein
MRAYLIWIGSANALGFLLRKNWGSGIYTTHFLWIAQGGWGVWVAAS